MDNLAFHHVIGRDSGSSMQRPATTKQRLGRWLGEFVGTFFLVTFIKLTALGPSFVGQYGIGFGVVVLVYQYGYITGGQFNPCVSIGLLCRGDVEDFPNNDYQNIIMYLIMQFMGAITAGFFTFGITDTETCSKMYPSVGAGYHDYQAFGAEFMFTFLLVFLFITVATAQPKNQYFGLSIGWTVYSSIGCIGAISGCVLNVAVWLGTMISASVCAATDDNINNITWKYAWIYIVGDIGGAMAAGFLFRFLFNDRKQRAKKMQKLITECLGTFFLVCLVKLTANSRPNVTQETIGIGLIVLVYLFGWIGGAHFNPSVSLGMYLTQGDDFTISDLISYICVQLIGATIGGLFCYGIGGKSIGQFYIHYDSDEFNTAQAFTGEVFFTFLLVNCILHVTTSTIKDNQFYGLAVGSCLGAAVGSIGVNGISGACLNLAVWFGTTVSALLSGLHWSVLEWSHIWIYCVAPFIGAILAALLFKYLYQDYDQDNEVDSGPEKQRHQLRKYVAEFLGSLFLVLVIKLSSSNLPDNTFITPQITVAFVLASLIYQWGYISQAHFNPAITIGVWIVGDIEGFDSSDIFHGLMYIIMQLLGGFSGGLIAWGIGNTNACNIYPDIVDDKEDYQVFCVEFIFTFLLVTLLLFIVRVTKPSISSGVSVGWMVMATIGAIGSLDAVSGCCLNPMVWFGTIMSAACCSDDLSNIQFKYIWCFFIAEFLAGVTAGLCFRYLFKEQHMRDNKFIKYLVEFIGTFYLVSFIKLSLGQQSIFYAPLSIGFGLCILVYCFGNISGGHYNPAVTLGIVCRGNVHGFKLKDWGNVLLYIISQCLGGFAGGLFSWFVGNSGAARQYPKVQPGFADDKAFAAEYVFTFLLVSAVIHCGIPQKGNDFYGMAYGFTLFVAVNLIGPISGAALNPAVWLGTIMSAALYDSNGIKWDQSWIYLIAPLLGGITAGVYYKLIYYIPEDPQLHLNIGGHPSRDIQDSLMDSSPRQDRL